MQTLQWLGVAQVGLAIVIAALTFHELRYFRRLWIASQTAPDVERSWLLGGLQRLTATIIGACIWFTIAVLLRSIVLPTDAVAERQVLTIVSAFVIIIVLLQPRMLGQQFRRRARLGIKDNEKE